ncbi:MAG TPA: hypothetical protein VH107_14925, partial [Lacipirellulaceae bacterium]|nr:hypothetical protein [Lacipirellulaceae bacterium]
TTFASGGFAIFAKDAAWASAFDVAVRETSQPQQAATTKHHRTIGSGRTIIVINTEFCTAAARSTPR